MEAVDGDVGGTARQPSIHRGVGAGGGVGGGGGGIRMQAARPPGQLVCHLGILYDGKTQP